MSADWYYIKSRFFGRHKRVGPISELELMKLIEKGEVRPDTLLSSTSKTHGHWVAMRDIKPAIKHWKKHHPDAAA
ncbi:MAG: hypothetical protein KatS3mg111_4203 [Pirellulaceae bacterium]|nr:MAG: hypothetical protein KatS3mg111_4203 [Pirellulaceae bacterium]